MIKSETGADGVNQGNSPHRRGGADARLCKFRKDQACKGDAQSCPVGFPLVKAKNTRNEAADPLK